MSNYLPSEHLSTTILELTFFHAKLALSCLVRATSIFKYITGSLKSGNPEISPGGVQNEKIENP